MNHFGLVATAARAIVWPFNTQQPVYFKSVLTGWLVAAMLLLAFGAQAIAPLKRWNGSANTNWAVASNWTPAAVPVAGDSVVIPIGVSNNPVIFSGTLAKAKNVRVNFSTTLTINAGGELELVSTLDVTGFLNRGTTTNNGTLKVKSGFHGIDIINDFTNNGTIVLGETSSSPYAFTEEGIRASGIDGVFTNNSTGVIVIYRAGNNGILVNQGGASFINYGKITIRETGMVAETAGTGDGIDARGGDFVNETTGDIYITRITANGLNCRNTGGTSSFTNKGKITIRNTGLTEEFTVREGINNEATFTNAATGQISIDSTQHGGIFNQGIFDNAGQLIIGALLPHSINGPGIISLITFNNKSGAVLTIKNTASDGIFCGLYGVLTNEANATLTINATGGDAINSVGLGGVDNRGNLLIGNLGAINGHGINNASQIINQFGAELNIQNTLGAAIYNVRDPELLVINSDFKNAGRIVIGASVNSGGDAIVNGDSCKFENLYCVSKIDINFNNTVSNGAIGSFKNAGLIVERGSGNSNISENTGVVQNLNGGTFTVTGVNNSGVTTASNFVWTGCESSNWTAINNWSGSTVPTATDVATIPGVSSNDPVITTAIAVKSVAVLTGGLLTVNASGSLTLNGAATQGLLNQGTVDNNGLVNIGSTANTGTYALLNEGTFGNNGEVRIDYSSGSGLYNKTGTFNNAGYLTIGTTAGVGANGILNEGTFNNTAGGEISIGIFNATGLYNKTGTFNNSAAVVITSAADAGAYGLQNESTLNNNGCGQLLTAYPVRNTNTFNNAGFFSVSTTGTHTNTASLINNGVIDYPEQNPIPNVTNNDLILLAFSGDCAATPALRIGGMNSFIIGSTWYLDPYLTQPVGTFNQATNTFTPTNLAEGSTYTLYFTVNDNVNNCGGSYSVQFTYNDLTPPVLICPANKSAVPSSAALCTALVTGLNATVSDNCSSYALSYFVASGNTGRSGDGQLTSETFNSGVTYITYVAVDGSTHHNSTSCAFTVTVAPCVNGRIIWKQDNTTGVKDVTVTATGDYNTSTVTAADGVYGLVLGSGANFTVTPAKNLNKLNGVNAQDVSRMQQHLMGNLITDPWQLIAADANSNGVVNSLDLSILQNSILGNPQAQAQMIKSWRFVPTSYTMTNPPWGFPENIALNNLSGKQTNKDFYGVKVGDVVAVYANPANTAPAPAFVLTTSDQFLQAGQEVSVELHANQATDLEALQFGLHFDPEHLELLELTALSAFPLTDDNFGLTGKAQGDLNFLWAGTQGTDIPEAAPVFRLKFRVLESGRKLSEVLQLNEETLLPRVYRTNLAEAPVVLHYLETTSTNHPTTADPRLQLLQNQPNPFITSTKIGFELPEDCVAQLRIFDAGGRVVALRNKQYSAGLQNEVFELEGVSGVLYYELSTPFGILVKKMVVVGK